MEQWRYFLLGAGVSGTESTYVLYYIHVSIIKLHLTSYVKLDK